jgi:lambda family phage minor tail protein L
VVYARFLDAVNLGGNPRRPGTGSGQPLGDEQLSELKATTATFVLATPTETDGSVFPARIMLADVCNWTCTVRRSAVAGRLWRMSLISPRQTRQKMPAANAVPLRAA